MRWFVDTCLYPYSYGFCPDARTWARVTKMITGRSTPYPTTAGCCTSFHNFPRATDCSIVTIGLIGLTATVKRSKLQIVGLLAHEATHVYQNLVQLQGDKQPSDEFMACAVQRITMDLVSQWGKL
jgi:hypothetical protein